MYLRFFNEPSSNQNKSTSLKNLNLSTVKLGLNLEISVSFVTKVLQRFPDDTLQQAYSPLLFRKRMFLQICEGL